MADFIGHLRTSTSVLQREHVQPGGDWILLVGR